MEQHNASEGIQMTKEREITINIPLVSRISPDEFQQFTQALQDNGLSKLSTPGLAP